MLQVYVPNDDEIERLYGARCVEPVSGFGCVVCDVWAMRDAIHELVKRLRQYEQVDIHTPSYLEE